MACSIEQPPTLIIIGYGNPGRCDDGLGPALAEAVRALRLPNVAVESNYQLNIEDAEAIARFDTAVFADSSMTGAEPFVFERIRPKRSIDFTSHSVSAEAVIAMAHDWFDSKVMGYSLAIRGHRFDEFGETLSERARLNLMEAVEFLRSSVSCGLICEWKDRRRSGNQSSSELGRESISMIGHPSSRTPFKGR